MSKGRRKSITPQWGLTSYARSRWRIWRPRTACFFCGLKKNRKSEGWFYGLGFWTRGNAEVCLLATRGHPKRQAANVHQFIISPIQEHSRKPEEARDKIVALMGDVPRVELFARQSPPGWDVWGNEVESTLPDFWTKCPEVAGPERSD